MGSLPAGVTPLEGVRVTPVEGGDPIGVLTRVTGLSCGIVCMIPGLAILVQRHLVMDRWMDTGP